MIAKQIITAHGGDIQIDSEPGRGSSFTFTVPVAMGGAARSRAPVYARAEAVEVLEVLP
jgi:light-regulated signal transduction histidine kinase (bacteriophytochrome)